MSNQHIKLKKHLKTLQDIEQIIKPQAPYEQGFIDAIGFVLALFKNQDASYVAYLVEKIGRHKR